MMGVFRSLGGTLTLKVVSADIARMLRTIESAGIVLYRVQMCDELTVFLQIAQKDQKRLIALLNKRGAEAQTVRKDGLYYSLQSFLKRPVLVTSLLFLILAGLYLPTRIFFFRVEGNTAVPTRLILEAAGEAGISFGASARQVRSEKVKNTLLQEIPQLQWAGINTSGCVATISVKERQENDAPSNDYGVSSIVAVRDGVICDMTVTNGNPLCKVGQAVSAGQVLISGYTNCDQSIRATRSRGEVYASTMRRIEAVMPSDFALRGTQEGKIQKFGVIFGKKRINFYSGSGILDSSCVKMYEENYVTLPGGFQLPVAIVTETWITCQERTDEPTAEDDTQRLSALARQYLSGHMVAGSVLSQNEQFSMLDGAIYLTGEYGCIEMIGREQIEEIIKP